MKEWLRYTYLLATSHSCGILIAYFTNLNFLANKQVEDRNGHIFILDVNIDIIRNALVNIYNADTKVAQVQDLSKLRKLMKDINFSKENCTVLAGDPNVFLDNKLKTKGGKASLTQKPIAKLKGECDLYDISRIRNPTKKLYTLRQNHSSGIKNCRLVYIITLHKLQEFSNYTHIISAFKTDHSSVLVIIINYNFFKPGSGLWKFNNSLINDEETFANTFETFIQNMINKLNTNTSLENQLKW